MAIKNRLIAYAILAVISIAAIYYVMAAVPLGPSTFNPGASTRQNESAYPAGQHEAYAGNITQLTVFATAQTKHWQGYYGEVTGTIVLDDAQNFTLYDWPNAEPKGEIYATANSTTPSWATALCFNYTGGADGSGLGNVTVWENFYNMTWNDVDGINETFNMTSHPAVDIGDVVTILENTCPSTYTHVSDAFQTDKFVELLLSDQDGRLIFTTIIENDDTANNTDPTGYNDVTHDFQMLVAEDGTSRTGGQINTATTTYYFYVDLE